MGGPDGAVVRHILMFPQYAFPCEHAMLETVYAKALPQRGHHVSWIMEPGPSAPTGERTEWHGTPVWLLRPGSPAPAWGKVMRPMRRIALRVALGERVATDRPLDLVQVRNELSSACAALILRRRLRIPFVFQLSHPLAHDFRPADARGLGAARHHLESAVRRTLQWQILRRADLVFAISDRMRLELIRDGLDADKVMSVPLAVDGDVPAGAFDRQASRTTLGLGGAPTIVYFGVTDRPRKLDFLLDVILRVRSELPDVRLLVVGDAANPPDHLWLEGESARRGLDGTVRFLGRVPRARVPFYLAAADVSVAPIPPDPVYVVSSPTKVLESLARAVPVVANMEIPDQHQVISESGGGESVPYDVGAFAAALVAVLKDPARARLAGQRGREYVMRRRSYDRLADEIEGYYANLLERWARRRRA